jgi:hypothetical protein
MQELCDVIIIAKKATKKQKEKKKKTKAKVRLYKAENKEKVKKEG